MPPQTDRVGDVIEFFPADFVQLLATGGQLLVDLDRRLRHLLVGFLSATNQGDVWPGRDPAVAVRIQTDSQEHGLGGPPLLVSRIRHAVTLRFGDVKSSQRRKTDCFERQKNSPTKTRASFENEVERIKPGADGGKTRHSQERPRQKSQHTTKAQEQSRSQ